MEEKPRTRHGLYFSGSALNRFMMSIRVLMIVPHIVMSENVGIASE